jgi:dienelactone hydrolase
MNLSVALSTWLWVAFIVGADDVPWLKDTQQPPTHLAPLPRPLTSLLTESEFRSVDVLAVWRQRRKDLGDAWQKVLGPDPVKPGSAKIEVLQTEELETISRKLIRYENEVGEFLTAYLLEPIGVTNPRPAIVALHATTNQTNRTIAGIGGTRDEQIGLRLAQRGFVVICPENFLWRGGMGYQEAVANFQKRYPNSLGMRKMLFDASRAIDIVASLPTVDSQKIGAVGHSLGAKEVLYLTALDERISAAVFSEGGIEFESTNWQAPWYLGPAVSDKTFPRNHHELIALIAPRPFLVLGGESSGAADGDRSWPYLQAAMPVYRLYGKTPRLGLLNHHQGHTVSDQSFERLAEWFECYLK